MTVDRILAGVLAMGILAAVFVAVERHRVLTAGQTVEFALSLPAARESSVTQAFPLQDIIERFRSAGASTLLVRGMTLQTLLDYGGTGFPTEYPVWLAVESDRAGRHQIVIRENPELAAWVEQRLVSRLGAERVQRGARSTPELLELLIVDVERNSLLDLNLGVHPVDLALATRLDFRVAVELSEDLSERAGPPNLPLLLEGVEAGTPILFTGRTSLGEPATASTYLSQGQHPLLIDHSLPPFSPGLAPGVSRLNLPGVKMLRVAFSHTSEDVVAAVRDRQMRLVLLQPFHLSGNLDQDLQNQTAIWAQTARELQGTGLDLGRAEAIRPYSPSLWLKIVVALGVGAAVALLLSPLPSGVRATVVVATGAMAALPAVPAMPAVLVTLTWQLIAFLAAVVLPVLGAARSYHQERFVLRIGLLVGAAFAGGMAITALLGDSQFALELQVFRGVKVAMIVPLLLWMAWIVWRERAILLGDLRPRLWHLGALAVVLAGLWVMTVRSGNAVEWQLISSVELKARLLLERALVVRPRFKEFLLGWPFVVLAYTAFQHHRLRLSYALTAVGLIGMASMVNSFAHLHTPVLTSLMRGLHGVWIGLLVGYLAAYLLPALGQLVARRWRGLSNAA